MLPIEPRAPGKALDRPLKYAQFRENVKVYNDEEDNVYAEAARIIIEDYRKIRDVNKFLDWYSVRKHILRFENPSPGLLALVYRVMLRFSHQFGAVYGSGVGSREEIAALCAHKNCPNWIKQEVFASCQP
jgi:hypothetical protein